MLAAVNGTVCSLYVPEQIFYKQMRLEIGTCFFDNESLAAGVCW